MHTINIPDTVYSIGGFAFVNVYALDSIVIPISVIIMGHFVFQGDSNLTVNVEAPTALGMWESNWADGVLEVVWSYGS